MAAREIVILTGAGISAESGLSTFRDKGGLWSQVRLEDVATPEGYARDPDRVLAFYNGRRENLKRIAPNPAHLALGRLQRDYPGQVSIVTQNVDNLHERGGAAEVIHMHGQLSRALCSGCGHQWDWPGPMNRQDRCMRCRTTGTVRPDVVWFGEIPYHMDLIAGRMENCGLFVSIGTSGAVYPAAGLVAEALARRAETLEINLEPSENATFFHDRHLGPASETVPAWVEEVLRDTG